MDVTLGIKKFAYYLPEYPDSVAERDHERYNINNIYVITDYLQKGNEEKKQDTVTSGDYKIIYSENLHFRPEIISSYLVYLRKGDLYQHKNADNTYKALSDLKAFKLINIQFAETPGMKGQLDCKIFLTPLLKQAFTIEAEGTNTSSNLGILGSVVYQNRNVFGGMEVLDLKFKGGLQGQSSAAKNTNNSSPRTPFNTIQFGPEANFEVPRFLLPFTVHVMKNAAPRTRFTAALNYQSQYNYTRYAGNATFGYTWKESPKKRHTINPLEISLIKIDKLAAFDAELRNTNNLLILNSFTDHFVTATRYSFVYTETETQRKKRFPYFRGTFESSGNILRGINNLTHELKDTDGSYRIMGIKYSQYIKAEADFRYYKIFNENKSVVFRVFAGAGKPLDNLKVLPFEKSFFAGGTNGIRAWKARSLGPGGYASLAQTQYYLIGDGQLEGNIEFRFKVYKMFRSALFIDAGNIWLVKKDAGRPDGEFELNTFYKQLALGTGIGARLDFSFFILRLDLGIKVRDPALSGADTWVIHHWFDWIRKDYTVYGKKYNFATINFAIGYPF